MNNLLPLVPINPNEPLPYGSSCGISNEVFIALLKALSEHFAVDAGPTVQNRQFIFTNNVPGPEDRDKVWVKLTEPYAVGYFINGEYQMDYGMMGFPVNSPFLYDPAIVERNIEGLQEISGTQLIKYGITDTKSGADERLHWFIFKPSPISV